jgi:hypothetical protein
MAALTNGGRYRSCLVLPMASIRVNLSFIRLIMRSMLGLGKSDAKCGCNTA